jgi:hypothetical protein
MKERRYQPQPVRRVYIPKPGSRSRQSLKRSMNRISWTALTDSGRTEVVTQRSNVSTKSFCKGQSTTSSR